MKRIITSGLIAGLGMLAVSFIINFIIDSIFPVIAQEYQNNSLFRPWSDPLMSLIFIHPFILGVLLAFAWNKVKYDFSSPMMFGFGFWVVATIPGMLISYSSFAISLSMIASWTINGFIQILTGSLIIGFFIKK